MVFSPHGSPIILVLSASNIITKFRPGHPCGGAKYGWGIKMSRFCTNKSLYLADDTIYRHSYYGRLIGTHMRSIKWCNFQWPWTNPYPVFKVTPFFDAKYLSNGYRYGHIGWAKLNGANAVSFVVVKHVLENFDNFSRWNNISFTHFEKHKVNTFRQMALQKLMISL